ncbi:MAG: deoxyribodipyrimidine photo-lyase [Bacteroidia bacterium]
MQAPIIYWFRQDLRLNDLPALQAATATGQPIIACYVLDDVSPGQWSLGAASRWWLHQSLQQLDSELRSRGGKLLLRRGAAPIELPALAQETGASAVYCSRQYEPWAAQQEEAVESLLEIQGVSLHAHEGSLLFSPDALRTGGGTPFKVFTPFWRRARSLPQPAMPLAPPQQITFCEKALDGHSLQDLALQPTSPDWAAHWSGLWEPGSKGAGAALSRFLNEALDDYDESRNHPARKGTSKLSAHMHFGEISPRQIWHAVLGFTASNQSSDKSQSQTLALQRDKFLSELGWREFSHHLLTHFPQMPQQPLREQFLRFPWSGQPDHLAAWQSGQTGYPIVDAGMRELWQTGVMHNRVRMIVASFLTKHLLLPWQLGEQWFWDTLVDANLANNSCGWQWVAGCGADASPYFRIFNPTLQGQKFDKEGIYIKRWVPELKDLPAKYLHEPASAPANILNEAGVVINTHYPAPIVNHKEAREAALAAFAAIKSNSTA